MSISISENWSARPRATEPANSTPATLVFAAYAGATISASTRRLAISCWLFMVFFLSFIDHRNGRILFCLRMPQLPHLVAGRQQVIERASRLDAAILQHNDL